MPIEPELPRLETLGDDLLATTSYQRWLALARPFLGLAAYALAAVAGLWWLTPWLVFLIFVAVVTATHDIVHGSLGLSRRQTDWALFVLGAVLLESGHAYRTSHLRHHAIFPGPDDPEGDPARLSTAAAILWGPLFLPRLWLWAFARSRPGGGPRCWLIAEAAWSLAVPVFGLWLWPRTPAVLFVVRGTGNRGKLGLPAPDGPSAPPRLRRDAADPDAHALRSDHPGGLPGVDVPPGAPPLPGGAEPQPPGAFPTPRPHTPTRRRPAPSCSLRGWRGRPGAGLRRKPGSVPRACRWWSGSGRARTGPANRTWRVASRGTP